MDALGGLDGGGRTVEVRGRGRREGDVSEEVRADTTTVARATRWTAASQFVTQGVKLLTNVVLARLLTPDDFGVVAIALVVTMLLDQLKDMGTGAALIQRPSLDPRLTNAVFYLNMLLGAALALVLFAGADLVANLLNSSASAPVLRAFALVTFVSSLGQIHHSLLRRDLRFAEIAIVTSVSALVTAAVSIGAALMGQTFWALVYGTAAGVVVGTVMVWHYDRWRPSLRVHWRSLGSIWGFSIHLFLSNLLFFFFNQVDKIIISNVVGGAGVGVYSMAQRTVQAPVQSMSSVVGEVTFPAFSRRQDDDAALRSGFIRSSQVIALVTFPVMFGLAAVASSLVPVVFGQRWDGLVPLLWILAPIFAVQSVTATSSQLLLAKGRSDISFRWGLVYSVVLVAFELVAVRWGVTGVAAAYALGVALLTPTGLVLAFRPIGLTLRAFGSAMWGQVVATAGMVAVALAATAAVRLFHGPQLVELGAGVLAGAAGYLGLVFVLRLPALTDAMRVLRDRRG